MNVIFEDNHLLVIDKRGNIPTQQTELKSGIVEEAKKYIKKTSEKKGDVFLHPIHRLDAVTSGIVICAKTSKALSRLNTSVKNREYEKIYIAECSGEFPDKECVLETMIGKKHQKACFDLNGKKASLSICKVYNRLDTKTSIVVIHLHTGRYHQIRFQLARIGHPIIGDERYGSKKCGYSKGCIHLHHAGVLLLHPVTKDVLKLTSRPPFLQY